jgi:hypothetical protein
LAEPAPLSNVPVDQTDPGAQAEVHIAYAPRTVVIDAATARSHLLGVTDAGTVYEFNSAAGPLAKLVPGKVMLLQGTAAGAVTAVSHRGGSLFVTVSQASLGEMVQSGTIDVDSPPDFTQGFSTMLEGPSDPPDVAEHGADATDPAAYGPRSPNTSWARAEPSASATRYPAQSAPTVLWQNSSGTRFNYKIGVSGEPGGFHVVGMLCYQLVMSSSGNSCSNRTGGLGVSISLDGYITWSDEDANITIAHGDVTKSSFHIKNLHTSLKFSYTAVRGEGAALTADAPVFRLPYAFEFPICPTSCGGLPLYSKVQLAFLIKLGISSKYSVLEGGANFSLNGSSGVSQTGSSVAAAGESDLGSTAFVSTPAPSTAVTSGLVLAVQFKVGAGLGVQGFNALYYVSPIATLAQATGSAIAGQFCGKWYANLAVTGNAEVQILGFRGASSAIVLWKSKQWTFSLPGC